MTPLIEAAERAGATYRQANTWVMAGYLEASYVNARNGKPSEGGSGSVCVLSEEEANVLGVVARLVKVGFLPGKAAPLSRELVRQGWADLGGGIHLTMRMERET